MFNRVFTNNDISKLTEGSADYYEFQYKLIQKRPLVRDTYALWYNKFLEDFKAINNKIGAGKFLELGSGGSYLNKIIPEVITSDVVQHPNCMLIDARKLPFDDNSLNGIFMTHVFHHIPNVETFLNEANRTLKPGGRISMVDVANTPLSRFFFKNFHHEPFNENQKEWSFDSRSNIDANQALTWMVFERDFKQFQNKFPNLKITKKEYLPWLGYTLSGGVTRKDFVPSYLIPLVQLFEKALSIFKPLLALHWYICVEKN